MTATEITWPTVVLVIGVLLFLAGAYVTVHTARNAYREEARHRSAPFDELRRRMGEAEASITRCQQQLSELTAKDTENDSFRQLMLRSQMALLRHEVDGNNIHDLEGMQQEIQEYLISR